MPVIHKTAESIEEEFIINSKSEEDKIKLIKDNPYNIRHIKNPSEAVQLAAVRIYKDSIMFIDKPTKLVQIELVKNYNYNYDYFFVEKLTSPKALELYYKLKKVHGVIK